MKSGLLRAAELCDEIANQFEKENRRLYSYGAGLCVDRLRAEAAALPDEDESLRRDAERYRWLRKKHASPCDYDTSIDAARRET